MSLFSRIYVESQVRGSPQTANILKKMGKTPIFEIEKIESVFGRVKKPYLDKRHNLFLFIGRKEGALIKEAPPAYGYGSGKHFYFVHAYNCIFECEYCYLQGYFDSPDIVFFVNHDEIALKMREVVKEHEGSAEPVWFHAGEFSDSLAMAHLSGELPLYFQTMAELPQARLELRTKSSNLAALNELPTLANVVVSFSLSPSEQIEKFEHKCSSLSSRLNAIKILSKRGFKIGLHFDPIVLEPSFETDFDDLLKQVKDHCPLELIEYASFGVVRFSKNGFRQFKSNYPESKILSLHMQSSCGGKVKYSDPVREAVFLQAKRLWLENSFSPEKLYLCMES